MKFVALWLAGIAVAVFFLQALFGTEPFVLVRSLMWQEPWRLLLSMFAHGSAAHLLSNIFGLALFGLVLEGRVGPRRVLWLFMAGGLLINAVTFYERSLGASGAIYALMGALIVLRPVMVIWVEFIPMPMALAGVLWLVKDWIGAFVPDGVANLAHISGLGLGLLAGMYWRTQGLGDAIGLQKQKRDPVLEKKLDEWEEQHMGR